jgi:hypothetical protein
VTRVPAGASIRTPQRLEYHPHDTATATVNFTPPDFNMAIDTTHAPSNPTSNSNTDVKYALPNTASSSASAR